MARASAFQAEGRGFESRFPLQIKIRAERIRYCAHVAQLVEHILGKDEVTSSILVVGSNRAKWVHYEEYYYVSLHRMQTEKLFDNEE